MSDYFDRIERQLVERVQAPSWRSRVIGLASGRLVPAGAVVVAVAVVTVFFAVGTHHGTRVSPGSGGTDLAYVARPANPAVPLQASLGIAVARLRNRLAIVRPAVSVVRHGDVLTLRGVTAATRATVQALARPGRLEFYDWEAIALTPDGRTVASQLRRHDGAAVTISQGTASGPGSGAGGVSLYRAVRLAARQAALPAGAGVSRRGPLYYLFGVPGSRACSAVSRLDGTVTPRGEHCLLAGPAASAQALRAALPPGVSTTADAEQLAVAQGTVVLQAAAPSTGQSLAPSRPTARFYVLRDEPSLSGDDVTHPRSSTDQSGSPDVTFGFTAAGANQFQQVTKAIVRRAAAVSPAGAAQQNQHFAIVLDQQLLSVPSIDFKQYPDGITGGGGADITGGFTRHSAQELATILRTGPLPVDLIPVGP